MEKLSDNFFGRGDDRRVQIEFAEFKNEARVIRAAHHRILGDKQFCTEQRSFDKDEGVVTFFVRENSGNPQVVGDALNDSMLGG